VRLITTPSLQPPPPAYLQALVCNLIVEVEFGNRKHHRNRGFGRVACTRTHSHTHAHTHTHTHNCQRSAGEAEQRRRRETARRTSCCDLLMEVLQHLQVTRICLQRELRRTSHNHHCVHALISGRVQHKTGRALNFRRALSEACVTEAEQSHATSSKQPKRSCSLDVYDSRPPLCFLCHSVHIPDCNLPAIRLGMVERSLYSLEPQPHASYTYTFSAATHTTQHEMNQYQLCIRFQMGREVEAKGGCTHSIPIR
jgi:hypothetical protein